MRKHVRIAMLAAGLFVAWHLHLFTPSDHPLHFGFPASAQSLPGSVDGDLPNRTLTPGAVLPDVTTAQLCVKGYSRTVRPVGGEWYELKHAAFSRYGFSRLVRGYTGDHLVPIEIGGDPRNLANIWPEPNTDAHRKDYVEDAAQILVCRHGYPLAEMQRRFEMDWRTAIPANAPFTARERAYLLRVLDRTSYDD